MNLLDIGHRLPEPLRAIRLAAIALVITVAGLLAPPARAQEAPPRTRRVATVGFYVNNIRDLDFRTQRFAADFYLWMRYQGEESRLLERLEFVNGRIEHVEEQERSRERDENYVCFRMAATFQMRVSLHDFPFDTQRLPIIIEHPELEADQLVYKHDDQSYRRSPSARWGLKNGLAIPEFTIVGTEFPPLEPYVYETDFGHIEGPTIGSSYSRLILTVVVKRVFWPYFFKIIIPFMVILGIAYLVFWLPPTEILSSVLLAITALVAACVFQLSISQTLPDVGYLIVSDKIFIVTIIMIFVTLIQSIGTFNMQRHGRDEAAFRLDVAARVVFPIVYLGAFGLVLLGALGAQRS